MAGVNKVILVGYVGRDAEVRYTNSGQAVANFSVATTEITGKDDDRDEVTEWHNIVCWARQAEIAGEYVKKGRQLYIEGRLQTRDWLDPQGVKHYKTEIVARNFQLLGRRDDVDNNAPLDRAVNKVDEYDIGDLGPPLAMESLSPGD